MCKNQTRKGDGFCNQNLRQRLSVHENVVLLQPFSNCGLIGSIRKAIWQGKLQKSCSKEFGNQQYEKKHNAETSTESLDT